MPLVLETAQIGVLALLDSISGMFRVIFNFGYNLILRKLFPKYRNESEGHAGFLAFGIMLSFVGIVLAISSFYLIEDVILKNEGENGKYLRPFAFLIPYLIFFRILFTNIDAYVRMLFQTVLGTFLDGFLTKLVLLFSIALFGLAYIEFDSFIYLYCLTLSLPGLIILIYALTVTKRVVLPKSQLLGESSKIRSYILFGILSGASSSIVQYVDTIMIYKLDGVNSESQVGIYSIMFFAAILISIPAKGLNKISAVILAESWKDNDLKNIQDIYKRSSINLLIIGGYLFIIGWACIDPVLEFFPEYKVGKYVFFFLGLAKLIELGTGVNADIIESSEKYRYNTYFNVILAILVIGLNYLLINLYGIIGAAIASFLAMTIVNVMRATLLRKSYKLWPFDKSTLKLATIVVFVMILASLININDHPVLEIVLNFIGFSLLYWFIIIRFKFSNDINGWLIKMRSHFLKK